MLTLSIRNQIAIGVGLALLVVFTRGQHFATLEHLPGASRQSLAFYVGIAAVVHRVFALTDSASTQRNAATG